VHDLIAITALGADTPRRDTIGGVEIVENPMVALASAAARLGREAVMRKAAAKFVGTALPGPGEHVSGKIISAFWTGPDQWMVSAPFDGVEDLAAQIKAVLGDTGSVTEQTDGWCQFDISGAAVPVLQRLCNVDVQAMQAGRATRTVIEHLGCFLICHEAARRFSVLGPRSSAGSMHHALVTAAKAVG